MVMLLLLLLVLLLVFASTILDAAGNNIGSDLDFVVLVKLMAVEL